MDSILSFAGIAAQAGGLPGPHLYLMASAPPAVGRIAAFQQNLPSLDTNQDAGLDPSGRLPLVHLLTNCATIQSHRLFDSQGATGIATNGQTFAAAYTAVKVLSKSNIRALPFVDPPVGVSAQTTLTAGFDVLDALVHAAHRCTEVFQSQGVCHLSPRWSGGT